MNKCVCVCLCVCVCMYVCVCVWGGDIKEDRVTLNYRQNKN